MSNQMAGGSDMRFLFHVINLGLHNVLGALIIPTSSS